MMTDDETSAEATRRWGERGYIEIERDTPSSSVMFRVGSHDDEWLPTPLGQGSTWEQAFDGAAVQVTVK